MINFMLQVDPSFFESISETFGKMSGLLTFIFLISALVLFMQKDAIGKLISSLGKRKAKKEPKKISELKYHNMFVTADRVLQKVNRLEFTTHEEHDEVKTFLIKKLIQLKIATVKQEFLKFLEDPIVENLEPNQLKFEISRMLSNLVNKYNEEARIQMINHDGISPKDAQFLIDCYEDFRSYIVQAFTDELESIVMDNNYDNNFERVNTILYTVSLSLSVIPKDVVQALNKVNGRFAKYKSKIKINE